MSVSRFCEIYKANDGKYYLGLTHEEYDYDEDNATYYGPFSSNEQADKYLSENFSNPGALDFDDRGTREPPEDVVRPRRGRSYGFYRY